MHFWHLFLTTKVKQDIEEIQTLRLVYDYFLSFFLHISHYLHTVVIKSLELYSYTQNYTRFMVHFLHMSLNTQKIFLLKNR